MQNVEVKDPAPEPQCSYYEQFVIDGNRFRLGKQGCHVVECAENIYTVFAQIDAAPCLVAPFELTPHLAKSEAE